LNIVALDCGGSRIRAGLYDDTGTQIAEAHAGPANVATQGAESVAARIADLIQTRFDEPHAVIAAAVAGARSEAVRKGLWSALAKRFPSRRIVVMDDLIPVLLANLEGDGAILITAGTGSCVLAADTAGKTARKGGRGPLLGDDGSAFAIANDALHRAGRAADRSALPTSLMTLLPKAAGVAAFDDLIAWRRDASNETVARLAETVCLAAVEDDVVACECLRDQAALLAAAAESARIEARLPNDANVLLHGGMFEHEGIYNEFIAHALKDVGIAAEPVLAPIRGHAAVHAVAMLRHQHASIVDHAAPASAPPELPATERKSSGPSLDTLDAAGIVQRMIATNAEVDAAMLSAADALAEAVEHAANAIRSGGRIIYAGAGTSGRLAVLDAAECRPTFGVETGRVTALMAGGERALLESVEEVEDNLDAGTRDLAAIEPVVNANDFVIGITASGSTPYPRGVVEQAAEMGATTALLVCNASSPAYAPLMIRLATGPEALPGSTRLKAGTATKLALNILSTGAFARAGHIYDGWMVGVRPVNAKLRARAARILAALTATDETRAAALLEDAGNRIPVALVMKRLGIERAEAEARLESENGDLRAVLND
jgi:N-acetylmuramic acid 6-phosphate etherase